MDALDCDLPADGLPEQGLLLCVLDPNPNNFAFDDQPLAHDFETMSNGIKGVGYVLIAAAGTC
jgi:hypothetical protein